MTKFQKQMLTIAAAGALTAVTALPAMAFENVFSGSYTLKSYLSNFDNGTSASYPIAAQFVAGGGSNGMAKAKSHNYTDQRLRIGYTAKASDDLKLVTQFEVNTRWGNTLATGAGGGGGVDTDGVNIQTRWAFLDFNMGKSVKVKAGLQPVKDKLKGLYFDADLPAAQVAYKTGGYTLNLLYSRFNDTTTSQANVLGDLSADLFGVENTYAFSKDTSMSLVYYLNSDNSQHKDTPNLGTSKQKKINTFGVSGQTKFGSLDLSAFAAMQAGYQKNAAINTATVGGFGKTMNYHGWAAATNAKMKVGSGAAKMGLLFASGNGGSDTSHDAHNNAWQTISATNNNQGQNSYNESGMMLLARNTSMGGTGTDNYFRKPVSNIALLTMGYDANLTDKLFMNGNVGFAWAPSSAQEQHFDLSPTGTGANNASDFMGTEINLEAGYKLYKNLTLRAQAAYVVLGGYYKNSAYTDPVTIAGTLLPSATSKAVTPENPYTFRIGASYSF